MIYIFIFIGGGLGAVCRYFISLITTQQFNNIFPFGTLTVNLIGSFLIGLFYYFFQNVIVPIEIRIFIMIGFLGGFTTFSSFSLESINLLRDGEYRFFILNVIINNIACLLLSIIGIYLGKLITKLIR